MSFISIVPGLSLPSASLIDVMYPVGSIYESDDPAPPNIVFGRGTWERLRGVMLIGVDETDADFNVAGKFGGEKTHVLTVAELPSHAHTVGVSGSHSHAAGGLLAETAGGHTHSTSILTAGTLVASGSDKMVSVIASGATTTTGSAGGHTHSLSGNTGASSPNINVSISAAGGGLPHNNLPPYRTTYMWRRTG